MRDMWVSSWEFQFGQRVMLRSGVWAYIARRTKIVGIKKSQITWKYSVVLEEDGKPGTGRITPVLINDPIVSWEENKKSTPVDDGTRQTMIAPMIPLIGEKAKKKARAA